MAKPTVMGWEDGKPEEPPKPEEGTARETWKMASASVPGSGSRMVVSLIEMVRPLSTMVPVPRARANVAFEGLKSATENIASGPAVPSFLTVTEIVLLCSPGRKLSVPLTGT